MHTAVLTLGFAAVCAARAGAAQHCQQCWQAATGGPPGATPTTASQASPLMDFARIRLPTPLVLQYNLVADVPKPFDVSIVSLTLLRVRLPVTVRAPLDYY